MPPSTRDAAATTGATDGIIDELERRVFQLETLYEIGRECARVDSVGDVLHIMLSMLMGAFGVVRGMAFAGDASGHVDAARARGLPGDSRFSAGALAQAYLSSGRHAQATADARAANGVHGAQEHERTAWQHAAGVEVCLPFTIDGSTHGAIALGPKLSGLPYTGEDRTLLKTIVANASAYLRNVKLLEALRAAADELGRKAQALAVANEIALGFTSRPSARRLHRFLVERIAGALDAAEGALGLHTLDASIDDLLSGTGGGTWTLAARYPPESAHDGLPDVALLERLAVDVRTDTLGGSEQPGANGSVEGHEDQTDQGRLREIRETTVPIRYGTDLIGALWLRRAPAARPFDADDESLLALLANEAAVLLENNRLFDRYLGQQQEQFRLRAILEQYLAPSVANRLISGETKPTLEGTRHVVTVLMVDMRGSTHLTTSLDPAEMVALLNDYLGLLRDVLFRYEGTIEAIEGDGMAALFGAPERHDDDPVRAARAAAAMRRETAALFERWRERYSAAARTGIGVGLATGEVIAGNVGSAKRLHYTTTGPPINLAARLTSKARAGTVLLDEATWRAVAAPLGLERPGRPRRPRYIRAKGFADLVPVYRLWPADVGGAG